MSNFTQVEIEYLTSQRLGRLATVSADGEPHNVPVGFRYNAELDTIDIGGHNIAQSKKVRDIAHNERVSFVVDDVLPPWKPRGRAEFVTTGGQDIIQGFAPELIRISPTRIIAWGIETDAYAKPSSRKVG